MRNTKGESISMSRCFEVSTERRKFWSVDIYINNDKDALGVYF